jgi:hypothetical protein
MTTRITGSNIQDTAVDTADLANSAVTNAKLSSASVTQNKLSTPVTLNIIASDGTTVLKTIVGPGT